MKTLITRSLKLTPQEQTYLTGLGLEITFHADEAAPVASPEQYEAVIAYDLFRANPLEQFANLKYLQITSAGLDHLPLAEINRRGIVLKNARGVYSAPMAEFALGGVLQLYKKSRQFAAAQAAHRWQRLRGIQEIVGKTVCVVGVGSIGSEIAKRFAAFDAEVIGVDIARVKSPYFAEVLLADRLEEALSRADIVVLTLPLMTSTQHMFDAARLACLKPGAVFVNVARGSLVDEAALIDALQSGRLAGAVLDVFEQEPLPEDNPLWDMPNVIVTPHNSFLAESNSRAMFRVVSANLRAYLAEQN